MLFKSRTGFNPTLLTTQKLCSATLNEKRVPVIKGVDTAVGLYNSSLSNSLQDNKKTILFEAIIENKRLIGYCVLAFNDTKTIISKFYGFD